MKIVFFVKRRTNHAAMDGLQGTSQISAWYKMHSSQPDRFIRRLFPFSQFQPANLVCNTTPQTPLPVPCVLREMPPRLNVRHQDLSSQLFEDPTDVLPFMVSGMSPGPRAALIFMTATLTWSFLPDVGRVAGEPDRIGEAVRVRIQGLIANPVHSPLARCTHSVAVMSYVCRS